MMNPSDVFSAPLPKATPGQAISVCIDGFTGAIAVAGNNAGLVVALSMGDSEIWLHPVETLVLQPSYTPQKILAIRCALPADVIALTLPDAEDSN